MALGDRPPEQAGAPLAGGVPVAPSIQGAGPQQAGPEQAEVPAIPDGAKQVEQATSTLMKFAMAQREQGNPAIAEAMKILIQAMSSGGQPEQQQLPPEGAAPQGIPQAQPVQGGNIPLNA